MKGAAAAAESTVTETAVPVTVAGTDEEAVAEAVVPAAAAAESPSGHDRAQQRLQQLSEAGMVGARRLLLLANSSRVNRSLELFTRAM